MLRAGVLDPGEDIHLDFVELMDPEQPLGIAPVRSGLPAKAGRESGISDGKGIQYLIGVIGRKWNLRGPNQIEVVGWNRIDLLPITREEASAIQRLLPDEDRGHHRGEAMGQQVVEGIPNQSELKQNCLTL